MPVKNQKDAVPFSYYVEKFAALEPQEVTKRLQIPFSHGKFTLKLLGSTYEIAHPDYAIFGTGFAAKTLPAQTLLLRYLCEGKDLPAGGEYKTFRQMPWGEVYAQPFAGRILKHAAFALGTRINAFRQAAEELGGRALEHGDVGYEFDLMGNYRLQLLLWEGDEEFPPSAQLLFSDNFAVGFTAEDRVIVGELLINALKTQIAGGNYGISV